MNVVIGASTTAKADDATDAKAAAVQFFRALAANNTTWVDTHFAGDVGEQKLLGIFRDLIHDSNALRTACIKRFDQDALKNGINTFDPSNMAADVEKFEAHTDGDTVHLQRPGASDTGLVMQKTGDTWKMVSLTGSPGRTAQLSAFIEQFAPVLTELADEVNAGKYKSTAEVQAAFIAKRQAVMKAWIAKQTASTTHPSP